MFAGDLGMNGGWTATWSRLQDKLFERALVVFPEGTPDRWERISGQVPGKTPSEVRRHYEDLVHDVCEIDSGRVEPPNYADESPEKQAETERKKGVPWTEEEHRLFLIGLQKYGKGDWRSISRNAVVTRTPTQVASHAQKYFLRLNSGKKDNKRSSIHDITAAVDGSSSTTAAASAQSADARELRPFDDLGTPVMDPIDPPEYSRSTGGPSQYQHFGFPM